MSKSKSSSYMKKNRANMNVRKAPPITDAALDKMIEDYYAEQTPPQAGNCGNCGHPASAHYIQVGTCNQCSCRAFQ